MTFEMFDNLTYQGVLEAQKKNPKVNLTDGYHKEIWRKSMKEMYKNFDKKTEEKRNDFTKNEMRRLKKKTKT